MIVRVNDPKERRAHFPPDLLLLLGLPAFAILTMLVGVQRLWILLLLIGLGQLFAGSLLLRASRSSLCGWLSVFLGVGVFAAGTYFALVLW